jgi:glycerophosphoryl diester phosphodiesterase
VIALERRDGVPLRIGHKGAATLAQGNTLASFRAGVAAGVDLVEFDVVVGPGDELVVAHSFDEIGPESPTLEDVLRFFVEEARETGLHVDLKEPGLEKRSIDALRRHGLLERAFVSAVYARTARRVAEVAEIPTGITFPRGVLGLTDDGRGARIARVGLGFLRLATPLLIRPLLGLTRADAVVLHHSVVTPGSVRAAHRRGARVVTWTVDDRDELARVERAGVDAIVTNDPRLFGSGSASTLAP